MPGRYAVSAHAEVCYFYKICTQFVSSTIVRYPLYTAGYTLDQAVGYTQKQMKVYQHLLTQPSAFVTRFQYRPKSPVSSMRGRNPKQ